MAARSGRTVTVAAEASTASSNPEAAEEQDGADDGLHAELVQLREQVRRLQLAKRDVPFGTPVLAQRERDEHGAPGEAPSDQGPRRSRNF